MAAPRLVRAGTPLEVSVLAAIWIVLAVGCLAGAAVPMSEASPRVLLGVVGAGALVAAAVLARSGGQVRPLTVHATVVALVLLRGVLVAAAATERGQTIAAVGYCWIAVYVAFFFRAELARAYGALICVALGVGLLLARAPADVAVWLWTSSTCGVAIAILTRVNASLRDQARFDTLTGLRNRAGLALDAPRLRAASERRGEPVALVVIDLDHFKAVNDQQGHAAGDRLLIELTAAWSATLRTEDLVARQGGDEFVLLLPGIGAAGVDEVLARLAAAHPARWTAGVADCRPREPLEDAVLRADAALYRAKAMPRLHAAAG